MVLNAAACLIVRKQKFDSIYFYFHVGKPLKYIKALFKIIIENIYTRCSKKTKSPNEIHRVPKNQHDTFVTKLWLIVIL